MFQKALGVCIALGVAATTGTATAQESRTTTGRVIGEAEWVRIGPSESEFSLPGGRGFSIVKKVFPARYQEIWRDNRSTQSGSMLRMFYERTNRGTFRGDNLEDQFEDLVENTVKKTGSMTRVVRYERIARGFRAAYIERPPGNCIMTMRIFGISNSNSPGVSGDRNMRITACKAGPSDDQLLKDTAIAFAAAMQQDDRKTRIPGTDPKSFDAMTAKLFGGNTTSSSRIAPDNASSDRRTIMIDWDGNPTMKTGTIFLRDDQTRGRILITVKGAFDQCNGNYNMDIGRAGAWNIKCNEGRTATGTFENREDGSVTGNGTDNTGAAIRFTMAPG